MLRSILLPLDGSPRSEHALPFALSIAQKSSATLHVALVHVPDAYLEDVVTHGAELDDEAKTREREYLDGLKGRLGGVFKGSIQFHHLEGIVPETLTEEVVERHIDLVVMNAHGWGYMSRALVGSVSDFLMRRLSVPLLLMHSQDVSLELARPMAFRRILIPLDGSELAETILGPAEALGQLFQAEFRLLRTIVPPRFTIGSHAQSSREDILNSNSMRAKEYLENLASRLRQQSAVVETDVLASRSPAAAILQEAGTSACDLIAISTHGRGGLSRLLMGSVADKVIRGAHTPVLVYHPPVIEE